MATPNSDPLVNSERSYHEEPILIGPLIITVVTLCAVVAIFVIYFVNSESGYLGDDSSFLFINDIHIDPLYNENNSFISGEFCRGTTVSGYFPFGQYGCDLPNKSYLSFLNYLKSDSISKPSFVVFAGDSVAHDSGLNMNGVAGVFKYIVDSASSALGGVPVYTVLGNNDYVPNYGTWETDLANFENIGNVMSNHLKDTELATFKTGGYYYKDFIHQKLRILFLNSVIYNVRRTLNESRVDPYYQFDFIRKSSEEALAKGYKIGVIMHISPGITYYDLNQGFHTFYANVFYNLSKQYNFRFVLTGHSHIDIFVPLQLNNQKPVEFSMSSPSLSPAHVNNPGFRIYDLLDGEISNYVQYYADIMLNPSDNLNWQEEYTFDDGYKQKNVSNNAIAQAVEWISTTGEGMWRYRERIYARADDQNSFFYCILRCRTKAEVENCTKGINTLGLWPYGGD